jgi:hypothetical protein
MNIVLVRTMILAAAATTLAGCASSVALAPPASLDRIAPVSPVPTTTGSVGRDTEPGLWPILRLPASVGAGRIQEVRRPHGLSQDMALSDEPGTPHPARVTIALTRNEDGPFGAVWPGRPSEEGIRAELAARFPGLTMVVVPQAGRNAAGPYGLAVGRRADGWRCIHAWQWLDAVPDASGLQHHASIRMSRCGRGVRFEDLTLPMDRLTLGPVPVIGAGSPAAALPAHALPAPVRPAAIRAATAPWRPRATLGPRPVRTASAPVAPPREPLRTGTRFLGDPGETTTAATTEPATAPENTSTPGQFPAVPLPSR